VRLRLGHGQGAVRWVIKVRIKVIRDNCDQQTWPAGSEDRVSQACVNPGHLCIGADGHQTPWWCWW
jgi:hypothetical protein